MVANEVHEADDDGADVGEGIAQDGGTACELHDLRRVVEDRVDTGELVEHRDAEGHEDDLAVAAREEGDLTTRSVFGDLRLDLVDLLVALCLRGGEALGDCDGAFLLSMSQEPARESRARWQGR